jgi:hypothetical protein
MVTVKALAGCALPLAEGCRLRLHSRFTHAVNLIDEQGGLFTLHRYGKGCSPFGWLLREKDFLRVSEISHFTVAQGWLHGSGLKIINRRRLNFSPPKGELALPDISTFTHPTGLLGPLNQAAAQRDYPALQILREGLSQWLAGEKPDWCKLIGLGPGLTPSGDDMLTGALAVLHSSADYHRRLQYHLILPHSLQLQTMTTAISCGYLDNAAKGLFSTPLLHLLSALRNQHRVLSAIRELLNHGHTSGADTLLGLATTLAWLREMT